MVVFAGFLGSVIWTQYTLKNTITALKHGKPINRSHAAQTLGKMGVETKALAPAFVPALVEALQDESADVRQNVAEALGMIGLEAKEAVPALTGALQDESVHVRTKAAEALEKINQKAAEALGKSGSAAPEAVPVPPPEWIDLAPYLVIGVLYLWFKIKQGAGLMVIFAVAVFYFTIQLILKDTRQTILLFSSIPLGTLCSLVYYRKLKKRIMDSDAWMGAAENVFMGLVLGVVVWTTILGLQGVQPQDVGGSRFLLGSACTGGAALGVIWLIVWLTSPRKR